MNNIGLLEFNRALVNQLETLATEKFTVRYIDRFGNEKTYTDNYFGVASWVLPDDQIVSIERA